MRAERFLIVNADDLGHSPGVNRGIARAHQEGIVTSASLLVRRLASADAGAWARTQPDLAVGLHVDLGEWVFRDELWVATYEVVAPDEPGGVAEEVARQVELFRSFVGRDPTHMDSHQHVHRREPARSALLETAGNLGVPLRDFSPGITFRGDFYGQDRKGRPVPQAVTVEALTGILRSLPEGVTELGCHPGDATDYVPMYAAERALELEVLCDPRIRRVVDAEGIRLCSFQDVDATGAVRADGPHRRSRE